MGVGVACWGRLFLRQTPRSPLLRTFLQLRSTSTSPSPSPPSLPSPPIAATPQLRPRNRRWTVEEDDTLIRLRRDGVPYKQMPFVDIRPSKMMQRLGKLAAGVRGEEVAAEARKVIRKHSPPTHFSESDEAEVVRLTSAGLSYVQIAVKINRSPEQVQMHSLRHSQSPVRAPSDLPRSRGAAYTIEEDALLSTLRAEGLTWREIARRMPHRAMPSLIQRYYQSSSLEQKYDKHVKLPDKQPAATTNIRTGRWQLSELIQCLELFQQGLNPSAIATRIGRTSKSVGRVMQEHNVRRSSGDPDIASKRLTILLENLRTKARQQTTSSSSANARKKRAYTPAELQFIADLQRDGTPQIYIAQVVGRRRQQIYNKARAAGLARPSWTETEKEQLVEYCHQGLTIPEIAKKLGRSEHSVRGNLHLEPLETLFTEQRENNGTSPDERRGENVDTSGRDPATNG